MLVRPKNSLVWYQYTMNAIYMIELILTIQHDYGMELCFWK